MVAILSMAFPIAIVGIMHAKRWRGRILYGVAVGILGVAMLSTYRKSALLAPVTVGLALATSARARRSSSRPWWR